MANFGQELKNLRKSAKKSQMELAKDLGWKQAKVSYLENMENPPKGELIKHIASYFGVEVSYFLAERQKENKKVVSTKAFEYLNNLRAHTQRDRNYAFHAPKDVDSIKLKKFIETLKSEE